MERVPVDKGDAIIRTDLWNKEDTPVERKVFIYRASFRAMLGAMAW